MALILHIPADLALAIGALPVPTDERGVPLALDPPRPTFLIRCNVSQRFYYWEVIPGLVGGAE